MDKPNLLNRICEEAVCESATGCAGAGGFRRWAEQQGYPHCLVLNWSSSAGDWEFIVSKDGEDWYLMSQENNWPNPGFRRVIETARAWHGPAEDVLQQVWEEFYR